MASKTWTIVWCPEDTSYSLIDEKDALFDEESLETGDTIKFFFNSKEYFGEVIETGNDGQYNHLRKRLHELNASNKKGNESFHDDRPRKTRGQGKFRDAVDALKPKRVRTNASSCSSTQQQVSKKNSMKPLAQLMNAYSSDDTECNEDVETSPDSSPMPESHSEKAKCEIKQLNRTSAAKGKSTDIIVLKRSAKNQQDKNNNQSAISSNVTERQVPSLKEHTQDTRNEDTDPKTPVIPVFQDSSDDEQRIPVAKKKRDKHHSQKVEKSCSITAADSNAHDEVESIAKITNLSMFRSTQDDPDVVELRGRNKYLSNSHFYISSRSLYQARLASNASRFSKHLLVGAFSDEALLTHTVSGGQYRAGGSAKITQKPALDQGVVGVIIEAAISRQEVKKWKPELSKKEILQGLRQKHVDLRPQLRKKVTPPQVQNE